MEQLNRIELCGYVGCVNESIIGESRIIRFSLVTNGMSKSINGDTLIESTWHQIVYFPKHEDTITLKKGDSVACVGRIKQIRYTDTEGNEHSGVEIAAKNVSVLPGESLKIETF